MQYDSSTGQTEYRRPMVVMANFDYAIDDDPIFAFYNRSKQRPWDPRTVIEWSDVGGGDNPLGLPLTTFPLARSAWFQQLSPSTGIDVIRHYQGWMVSQFLHGEQFGVLTASRIALEAPDHLSKLFAASQALDEAKHLESYIRLTDRIGVRYGLSTPFRRFLDDVVGCGALDYVYLGLQVIGEGIGLASFAQIRRYSENPQIQALYGRIMEDEARHVGFGRRFLRPLYERMTAAERKEREAFVIEACGLMDERFRAFEVWEKFGLAPEDAAPLLRRSAAFKIYRRELFRQIVPVIRDIGLWSRETEAFFASLGVAEFALATCDDIGIEG